MTTVEFITALFYEVDEQLHAIPKHPEAHLWPSAASWTQIFIYGESRRIMQYIVVRSPRC